MSKNRILIFGLLIAAVASGFFQEYLKINVNFVLETGSEVPGFFQMNELKKSEWISYRKEQGPQDFYHKPKTPEILLNLNASQLSVMKWVLTFAFILIFLGFNWAILNLVTAHNEPIRWLTIGYAVFFIVALCIYALGKLMGASEKAYIISRKIVGGLQSLVPLMMILPAFWLNKRTLDKT